MIVSIFHSLTKPLLHKQVSPSIGTKVLSHNYNIFVLTMCSISVSNVTWLYEYMSKCMCVYIHCSHTSRTQSSKLSMYINSYQNYFSLIGSLNMLYSFESVAKVLITVSLWCFIKLEQVCDCFPFMCVHYCFHINFKITSISKKLL